MSGVWRPRKGDHVQTKFGKGTVVDDYWAHRDRYTVRFEKGSENDFGCESLRKIER